MKAEEKIQQECFVWFWNTHCLKMHSPREIIFHVPNEGKGNGRLTSVGLIRGMADLIVTFKGLLLFIEVKTPSGRQSPAQRTVEAHVVGMHQIYQYHLVRSLEEFKNIINSIK